MRDEHERLRDIREAIERIQKYADKGRASFEGDELIQNWVVHHLQIIGEACRAFSPKFRDEHPEIPWSKIIGMRNILVHDYFGVDVDRVWAVVERDLPELMLLLEAILKE
ncbi:MAG: DUF86 domain-containing protein [Nitrospirae bacterium]|nr:DUF86 domain-containing protein [Nitrospirota bacterium]